MNYKTCQHGTDINRKSCLKCALEYESARNSITVKDSLTVQPDPQRKVEKWCECMKTYINEPYAYGWQFCPFCAAPRPEKKGLGKIARLVFDCDPGGQENQVHAKINELIDAVNALRSEGLVKE